MSSSGFSSCIHDQMLESNRDDVKLEAMRCITVMTAKGKLSVPRTLFPHIVKNVTNTNPELKKLIFLYLTSFADQEPDLALLPVATLQKSLKSPNPLVRSSALKVLTSMRINTLSGVLMATVRNAVNDLSPYVRKTVAHSIIKIYRLDEDLQEELIEYIERSFNDKNSMVLSSSVAAFEAVCPDRLDLVHKQYRRFCFLLADCNEWGQALLVRLMTRYLLEYRQKTQYNIDPKMLLRASKPLVHSNNSAVVMAVVKLYIAIANQTDVRSTIPRPLIRLLSNHREVQLMVLELIEHLTNIDNKAINVCQDDKKRDDKVDDEDEIVSDDDDAKSDANPVLGDNLNDHYDHDLYNGHQDDITKQNAVEDNVNEERHDIDKEQVGHDEDEEDNDDKDDDDDEEGDDDDDDDDEDDDDEEEEEEEDNENDEEEDDDDDDEEDRADDKDLNDDDETIEITPLKPITDPSAYREIFRPHLKSFFVKHTDCTQVKLAKLKILTNLSAPVNVSQVLRELQAYIATYAEDKKFVAASIQAMGQCSLIVKEVAPLCLNGLTSLLSNNNEHIVAEAIVVLRSQIINKSRAIASNKSQDSSDEVKDQSNNENGTDITIDKSEKNDKPEASAQSDENTIVNQVDQNGLESSDKQSANIDQDKKNQDSNSVDSSCVNGDHDSQSGEQDDELMVSTVIKQVTKLLPLVTAPQARATILWILAEFCQHNKVACKCAPNVLRSIAKSFTNEDNFVKLQALTLASKFLLSLDKTKKAQLYNTISLITSYLFSLAKYDTNHDVRDRGRFLKKLLEEEELGARVLNCASQHRISPKHTQLNL